jgi:hypothetical protein
LQTWLTKRLFPNFLSTVINSNDHPVIKLWHSATNLLSMELISMLVVTLTTRNVFTYVTMFPTSRDLSPIEDASVVIPTCFLRVLHVLPVVACLCSHFMFWLIFWHLHLYLYIYGSHSGAIKFYFHMHIQVSLFGGTDVRFYDSFTIDNCIEITVHNL